MHRALYIPPLLGTVLRATLALLILGVIAFYLLGSYRIVHTTVLNVTDSPDGRPQSVKLPYSASSAYSFNRVPPGKHKNYVFSIHTIGYGFQRINWQITPDDCVTAIHVNSIPVPLNSFSKKELCNDKRGFTINLGPYVRSGHNRVDITVSDFRGGIYKLHLSPLHMLFDRNLYKTVDIILIVSAWFIGWVLYRLRFDFIVIAIAVLAFYMYLWDFRNISNHEYTPDWWGHIPYVKHFRNTWLPPPPNQGWETYHPPTYYFLAHIAGSIGQSLGYPYVRSARIVSFISMLAFNLFGMLIMQRLIRRPWLQKLCISALLFWPLMHGLVGRISNEVMSYPFWAAIYYYLLRWYQERQTKHMAIALTLCGLMTLVRTTSIVPLGTIGVLGLIELFQKRIRLQDYLFNRKIIYSLLVILVCFGLIFGRIYYHKVTHAPRMNLIVSNMHKDPFLHLIKVKPTWYNMTFLDVNDLLKNPYVGIFSNREGRHLFWNSYIKTSLWGWFPWPNGWLAVRLNICLTLLILYAMVAPLFARPLDNTHLFLSISLLIGITAQITNRIITMSTVTHEGRMTFPIIILLIAWAGYVVQTQLARKRRFTALLGYAILLAFAGMAIWYGVLFTRMPKLFGNLF